MTYAPTEFEVTVSKGLGVYNIQGNSLFDLALGSRSHEMLPSTLYSLHHVTYSAKKFEVASSKGLGGDTFTRKSII